MQLRYIEIPAWSELSSPAVQQLKDARIRWIRKRERKINKINGVCRCSFSCSAIAFFGPGPGRFWSLEVTVPQSHALGTTPFAAPPPRRPCHSEWSAAHCPPSVICRASVFGLSSIFWSCTWQPLLHLRRILFIRHAHTRLPPFSQQPRPPQDQDEDWDEDDLAMAMAMVTRIVPQGGAQPGSAM